MRNSTRVWLGLWTAAGLLVACDDDEAVRADAGADASLDDGRGDGGSGTSGDVSSDAADTASDAAADASPDAASDAPPDMSPDTSADTPADAGGPREERLGFISPGADGLVRLGSIRIDGTDSQFIDMPGYTGISEAVWSGNGRRVAFTPFDASWRNDFADMQIMLMNADGTDLMEGPTGRFPALDYSGDVLAWVDFDTTEQSDPPLTLIRGSVEAFDYGTRTAVDLSGDGTGVNLSGPSTFVIPHRIWVHRGAGGVAVYAQIELSVASGGPGLPGSLNYGLFSFGEGAMRTLVRTDGGIGGYRTIGLNHEGDMYYGVQLNAGDATWEIRGGGDSSFGHTEVGGQIFSPNSNRTIQFTEGQWWFGSPTYEDREPIEFGLPIRPATWFERY